MPSALDGMMRTTGILSWYWYVHDFIYEQSQPFANYDEDLLAIQQWQLFTSHTNNLCYVDDIYCNEIDGDNDYVCILDTIVHMLIFTNSLLLYYTVGFANKDVK